VVLAIRLSLMRSDFFNSGLVCQDCQGISSDESLSLPGKDDLRGGSGGDSLGSRLDAQQRAGGKQRQIPPSEFWVAKFQPCLPLVPQELIVTSLHEKRRFTQASVWTKD